MNASQWLHASILVTAVAGLACRAAPEPEDETYTNGNLKTHGQWAPSNGGGRQRTGHWVFWYPSGQKKAEGDYLNGCEDATPGDLGVPVDGQRGPWVGWYESGQKAFEYRLDDEGRHVGLAQRWHANGQLASEAGPLDRTGHCVVVQRRADGSKWIESIQDDEGRIDGDLTEWDGEGMILKHEIYEHGKKVCRGQPCP